MLEIYKPGQGKYTRIGTFVGVVGAVSLGCFVLSRQLSGFGIYVSYGIPTAMAAIAAAFMYWVVNRPNTADFLIATESEMKKVSWSSRKEISGSTKVVIITTAILAGVLFGVDLLLVFLFSSMGIM